MFRIHCCFELLLYLVFLKHCNTIHDTAINYYEIPIGEDYGHGTLPQMTKGEEDQFVPLTHSPVEASGHSSQSPSSPSQSSYPFVEKTSAFSQLCDRNDSTTPTISRVYRLHRNINDFPQTTTTMKEKLREANEKCASPQDTLDTDVESLSSLESEGDYYCYSTPLEEIDENCRADDFADVENCNAESISPRRTQQNGTGSVIEYSEDIDEDGRCYDSDESGALKGHHQYSGFNHHSKFFHNSDSPHPILHEDEHKYRKGLTTIQMMSCWLLLLGFAIMGGNIIQMELHLYKDRNSSGVPSRKVTEESMGLRHTSRLLQSNLDHHHGQLFHQYQRKSLEPLWFVDPETQKNEVAERNRQNDLEVIRRTTAGKSRKFSVRLRPSERDAHGKIRRDLLLGAVERLAICSRVESIELDFSSTERDENRESGGMFIREEDDAVWLNHPSGKVKRLLSPDGREDEFLNSNNGNRNVDQYAVLLLDADVALSCDDLERGECNTSDSISHEVLIIMRLDLEKSLLLPFLGFKMWIKAPDQAVGFLPYKLNKAPKQIGSPSGISSPTAAIPTGNMSLEPVQNIGRSYNILSDRAMFVHRRYLQSKHFTVAIEAGKQQCERFILSISITSISRKPPIGVLSRPVDMRMSDVNGRILETKYDEKYNEVVQCLNDSMSGFGLINLPSESTLYLGRAKK